MKIEATPFVVLTSPRTGSTLLVDMLQSHPDIVAGGELFNVDLMRIDRIAWPDAAVQEDTELLNLRRTDPVAFVDRIYEIGCGSGARCVGFKLLYEHALAAPAVLDYLASLERVRIIHLERRNVLRQFVSLKQAGSSGQWHRRVGSGQDKQAAQPIAIELGECYWFMKTIFTRRRQFAAMFAGHPVLQVTYEDLAEHTAATGQRTLEFLGVTPHDLRVGYLKTGDEKLRDAISNYDELKAMLTEWASYCDD